MSSFKVSFDRWARFSAYGCLFLAALGTSFGARNFAIVHVGPFYILESLFSVWFLFAFIGGREILFSKPMRATVRMALLIMGYGFSLLLYDGVTMHVAQQTLSLPRVLQHSILYVYPFMWILAGAWLFFINPQVTDFLAWAILLVTGYNNLKGENIHNFAVGPLGVLFSLILLHQAWESRYRWRALAGSIVVGLLAFWPYGEMLHTTVQRTCHPIHLFSQNKKFEKTNFRNFFGIRITCLYRRRNFLLPSFD
jgi:hypothetical protein